MDSRQRKPPVEDTESLFVTPQPEVAVAQEPKAKHKGALIAHIDGGARGNPGPAGYGVHLQDERGNLVAEISRYLGYRTNNHAEYSALIAALEYAAEHGWEELKVISDSELLVKQIRGEYKVKSPDLKELYDRARGYIRKLRHFSIQHVLRAQNQDADRLANWAMDNPRLSETGHFHGGKTPQPQRTRISRELEGTVRDGKIELLNGELPEGTKVKVIVKG